MSELKRYDPAGPEDMDAVPHGMWVRYEDALTACEIARRDERERVYAEIMDWLKWYSQEMFPDPPKITDHTKTLWSAAVMREMIPRIAESIRTPEEAANDSAS